MVCFGDVLKKESVCVLCFGLSQRLVCTMNDDVDACFDVGVVCVVDVDVDGDGDGAQHTSQLTAPGGSSSLSPKSTCFFSYCAVV